MAGWGATTSPISRLARRLKDNDALLFAADQKGVKEDALFLANVCPMIEAVLSDAEEREIRDESVRLWLCDLRYLAADAEDLLEELEYHLEREEEEEEEVVVEATSSAAACQMESIDAKEKRIEETFLNGLLKMIQMICKGFKRNDSKEIEGIDEKEKCIQATFLNKLLTSIQTIHRRFDDINVRRKALKLKEYYGDRRLEILRRPPIGHLPNEPINIYGRDEDKKQLVDLLKNNKLLDIVLPNHENGYVGVVIGLVGGGGIGKTTLAQALYNDEEIDKYFDYKAWVTVSETFDVVRITKNILECFIEEVLNLTQLSVIQRKLAGLLQGKKFLLVLDDMWEEDKYDSLGFLLQMGLVGSKILITTRITRVVEAMCPSITFELEQLSEKDGWDLFCKHAFKGKSEDQLASDLVRIGKEIVKRCKGLPLLLKVLGNDLQEVGAKKKRWREILNHETWEINDDNGNNKVMEILMLSYNHLPKRLKQCFLHCSIFPKDYKFHKDELTRLWAAHGLIEIEGSQKVNDIGEECVYNLLQRSFIQSFEEKYSFYIGAKRITFSLHDVMHDLAQYILHNEKSLTKDHVNNILDLHRPSMVRTSQVLRCYHEPIAGRTFFQSYDSFEQVVSIHMLAQHLKHLRVLILRDVFWKPKLDSIDDWGGPLCKAYLFNDREPLHVPNSIGDLKHLRYLHLDTYFLPDSVCLLRNLQTLECPNLKELPRDIKRLKRLQHLIVDTDVFPPGIDKLVELQTLEKFHVLKGVYYEWARPSELNKLTRLGGEFYISGLNNIDGVEEAKLLNLSNKPNLQRLVLQWEQNYFTDDEYCQQSTLVLDSLMPHTNLEELKIILYVSARFPDWLGSPSFSMLTSVKLFYCFNCVALPTFGELPSLKRLVINDMTYLECNGPEFYGRNPSNAFLSLEYLKLSFMHNLREWWGMDICHFSRLSKLCLAHCPSLRFSAPSMDMRQHQPGLHHMLDIISSIEVFNCPYVEEWCKTHASTTSTD